MNTGPREWDAETYDQVSDPQFEWGMEVLERLELRGDEAVLDAGCGSGRVTAQLLARLPGGRMLAVDGSEAMVDKAQERLGERASYLVCRPLRAGGRGAGRPRLLDRDLPLDPRPRAPLRAPARRRCARAGASSPSAVARATSPRTRRRSRPWPPRPEFAGHFAGASGMWNFAGPEETEARLASRRLRRGALLAAAEAGAAGGPARVHRRPSPSARSWRSCPRRCGDPSSKRSSPSRSSR